MPLTGLLSRLGVHRREHVSVARDFSIYSAVNVVSLVLLLSTALMLRRYFWPYLGVIWTGLELFSTYVGTYAHFGTLTAAERDLPFLLGAGRAKDFDRLKHTLFWLSHGLGLLLGAGVVVTAFAFESRFSRQTFVGLLLYAPIIWVQLVATYYLVLYRARKRFVDLSRRQGLANLLKAGLLVAGGYAFGLFGVFGAELAAGLLMLALFHGGIDERLERVFDHTLIKPLVVDGLPMLAGAVAFETLRGADQIVILAKLGAVSLGVYSVTSIICQGLYYLPNALATVMYPRFQQRYGETQDAMSLRKFVELPLHVLADTMLAATAVLLVALPPAIAAFLPQYVGTIPALRVMLVGTYFLCLVPPAGQLLLTIHKHVPALLIGLPATALALGAAYVGSSHGLVGVATGVSIACVAEFVGVTAYAFSQFSGPLPIVSRLAGITGTAAAFLLLTLAVERFVPAGPPLIAVVGGWRVAMVAVLSTPLLARAAGRVRAFPPGPRWVDSVDNVGAGH